MAGDIRGITIEFRGDPTPLQKALRTISNETSKLDKELRQIDKGIKFNPTSVELWRQKQELLTKRISETKDKLDVLKQTQAKVDSGEIEMSAEDYRKLQRDIIATESRLKSFERELRKVGNVKLKALSEQFKQVGKKMTDTGKSLTRTVTAPLAGIGVASLKAGADFDTAMSQVAATSGKTVDEIGELRDFAIEMGSTTAFSATQAAEGLNYMALAGYDAEESMAMLPTVLNLAAAGAMELGAASDMVTDAQTALGLSLDETTDMVNQMAKTASTTNTSVSQLGEAILTIGPTAKSLKGGTVELNQVLGLLADNGIKGAEAGTHLRNIMLSLTPQTDAAAAAWDQLGVSAYDADGNLRPLQDTFSDLQKAMAGMSSEERTKMLSKMFNKTDLASVNALLDTDATRWDEVGSAIEGAGDAAEKMAKTQLDNMQGSLTLLKSALEGAGIAISDVLAPVVRKLADFLNALVTKFNELSPQAQKVIVVIGAIAAAIGPLLVIFGVMASSIGSILSLVGTIAPLLGGVGGAIGGLMTGSLLPIIAIIGGLIAAGIALYKNWDTIKAYASSLKTWLIKTWNAIKAGVSTTVNGLKTFLSNAWNTIKTTAQTVWNGIKDKIVTPIQNARDKIKGIIDKIKGYFPISIGRIMKGLKLPHFKISGKFSLNPPSVPHFNVDWYKIGGIFDSPSVIGVGEAGAEAVVPLDKFWKKLDAMQGGQNIVININGANADPKEIAEEVKRSLIRETNRQRLAWQ